MMNSLVILCLAMPVLVVRGYMFRSVDIRKGVKVARRFFATVASQQENFPEALLPTTIASWTGAANNVRKLFLYRDSEILVVYKPSGVLVCSDREAKTSDSKADAASSTRPNLMDMLEFHFNYTIPEVDRRPSLGLVHRIDSPCSGLVVFALTKAALRSLNEAFRTREVAKSYLCVVNGAVTSPEVCEDYLLKTSSTKTRVVEKEGRKDVASARMSYRPLMPIQYSLQPQTNVTDKAKHDKAQTLLEVALETGRKHQIRAQLSHRKLSIVGDVKYNAPQKFVTKDIALHAYKLEFLHPRTKKLMRFACLPPRVWEKRFGPEVMRRVDLLLDGDGRYLDKPLQ